MTRVIPLYDIYKGYFYGSIISMRYLIPALILLVSNPSFSQHIFGSWEGKPTNLELRIGFKFEQNNDGSVSGKMDSPDQNAFDIPLDNTVIKNDSVFAELKQIGFSFSGKLVDDSTLSGLITQGISMPIILKRKTSSRARVKPQTPLPPYPYNSEDVEFAGGDANVKIAGTISYPKSPGSPGKYPAILLIGGSGPSDRDHSIFGHKPFHVLADHLTRNGFLVLRVDDRGVGKSTGNYKGSTSEDFSRDASAAIDYLRSRPEVNLSKIGIAGHSEGGLIAPMVATNRKDIAFLVLLAAPGIHVIDLMTEQATSVFSKSGASEAVVKDYGELYKGIANKIIGASDTAKAVKKASEFVYDWAREVKPETLAATGLSTPEKRNEYVNEMVRALYDPWFRYFMTYDPQKNLRKLNARVLAINGEEDIQVISSSNLEGIRSALAKSQSPQPLVISLPGHNHLFQRCKSCTLQEYGQLDESFSPEVLNLITEWLKKEIAR